MAKKLKRSATSKSKYKSNADSTTSTVPTINSRDPSIKLSSCVEKSGSSPSLLRPKRVVLTRSHSNLQARVPVNAQTCKHLKTSTRSYHHEEIASKGKVIVKAANEEDAERDVVPKLLLANT
ncbi:hypothetical protein D9756_010928 [Leucocoprinus leucothites]|uniref:Uncharacterized protein n=1 Tax=Leucocoprinus leucothites TaxID=201217 RepID=A0A8H5CQF2_9AGAR|nr:hypothetical protein D9756_010928 [Leucoagaricus leucothites]